MDLHQQSQYEQISYTNLNLISKNIYETVLRDFSMYTVSRNQASIISLDGGNVVTQDTGTNYNTKVKECLVIMDDGTILHNPYEQTVSYSVPSANPRIDIVQVKAKYTDQSAQSRQFIDPITGNISAQTTYVEFLVDLDINIKQGTEGSGSAPITDTGYTKIAEVYVDLTGGIANADVFNVDSSFGANNTSWTQEQASTILIKSLQEHRTETILDHPDYSVTLNKITAGTGSAKTSLVGADRILIGDSADSDKGKYITYTNFYNTLLDINSLTSKTSLVGADEFILADSADSFNKKKITHSNLFKEMNWEDVHSSTSGYTINDTDIYRKFVIPHTPSTGLIPRNLPTLAANYGKIYEFYNSGLGLTKISSEEGSNILFSNGLPLSYLYLMDKSDNTTLLGTPEGWVIKKWDVNFVTGWINRSVWNNTNIGNGFAYSTKSGGSGNLLGEKGTEATSGNTFLCILDSNPSGASGRCYFMFSTGTGIYTTSRTITFGNGQTVVVSEPTGSNKNVDDSLHHGLGINYINLDLKSFLAPTASYTNSYPLVLPNSQINNVGTIFGGGVRQSSTEALICVGAVNGMPFYNSTITSPGVNDVILASQDIYINFKISVKK
jgi:hypothetical protein